MKKEIIKHGNRAIVIIIQETAYAYLCVNTKDGIENSTVTNVTWRGKTVAGAKRWAKKQLGI